MDVVNTHIGVYGIIIQDDKVALIRKARGGYKGKLDLPGGGMGHTEKPEDTLRREIMEKAGIEIDGYYLLDATAVNIKWQIEEDLWEDLHHVGILYRVSVSNLDLKKDADGLDSEGADWYKIEDLSCKELSPLARYGLEKLGYKLK